MGDKLESVVRPCSGGLVNFGLTGNSNAVYQTKKQLCISAFQDERYGKGLRLHTTGVKGGLRCTVCGFGNGIVRP